MSAEVDEAPWPLRGRSAVQEVAIVWSLAFGSLLIAFLVFGMSSATKLVATAGFLYLPLWAMRARGEDFRDYGVTFSRWREDLRLFLGIALVLGPLFFLAFWGFAHVLPLLPEALAQHLSPARGTPHFVPRLPPDFAEWVLDQTLVVALPEEFFYRGYVQGRLRDAWPRGRVLFGARLGPAFWVTALLFALGHLAIFQTWRLAVFFPALLFGWMRERTGTLLGATLLHASANLFVRFLEASFYAGP